MAYRGYYLFQIGELKPDGDIETYQYREAPVARLVSPDGESYYTAYPTLSRALERAKKYGVDCGDLFDFTFNKLKAEHDRFERAHQLLERAERLGYKYDVLASVQAQM